MALIELWRLNKLSTGGLSSRIAIKEKEEGVVY